MKNIFVMTVVLFRSFFHTGVEQQHFTISVQVTINLLFNEEKLVSFSLVHLY